MRVTAETRERTRERLLEAGRELFAARGLAATTVRDLAGASGVAVGTLFNYFAGKEALAVAIIAEATEAARAVFHDRHRPDMPSAEALFAHVAAELRALEPFRRFVAEVAAQAAGPVPAAPAGTATDVPGVHRLRETHLATVSGILADRGRLPAFSFVAEQLYWTLYTGVLAFWSRDDSRHQSETLALLDEALRLFVRSLEETPADRQEHRDAADHC